MRNQRPLPVVSPPSMRQSFRNVKAPDPFASALALFARQARIRATKRSTECGIGHSVPSGGEGSPDPGVIPPMRAACLAGRISAVNARTASLCDVQALAAFRTLHLEHILAKGNVRVPGRRGRSALGNSAGCLGVAHFQSAAVPTTTTVPVSVAVFPTGDNGRRTGMGRACVRRTIELRQVHFAQ